MKSQFILNTAFLSIVCAVHGLGQLHQPLSLEQQLGNPPTLRAADLSPQRHILPSTKSPEEGSLSAEPEVVGYAEAAPPFAPHQLVWTRVPSGGWVCRLEFESEGAGGLRVAISQVTMAADTEVRVYAPSDDVVYGPYTRLVMPFDGADWWSPVIFGPIIGVEYFWPRLDEPTSTPPQIVQIAYLYPSVGGLRELPCHEDVRCEDPWLGDASGVARIVYMNGQGQFFTCSGALLNRPAADRPWLFLTAFHCISDQPGANTVTAIWFFQHAQCDLPDLDPRMTQTVGTLFLSGDQTYDTTLLGLFQRPPGDASFLPYSTAPWGVGDGVAGIHHPDGTYKRFSSGSLTGSGFIDVNMPGGAVTVGVWTVNYTYGTVEGGSSGSPLFDSNHRIRGPLSAGASEGDLCPPEDAHYGRFDLAFPNFQPYLENMANPSHVDRNHNGAERGTLAEPFDTIYEATFAVRSGDSISIQSGIYPERLTLWRPMTIASRNGTVVIGQ